LAIFCRAHEHKYCATFMGCCYIDDRPYITIHTEFVSMSIMAVFPWVCFKLVAASILSICHSLSGNSRLHRRAKLAVTTSSIQNCMHLILRSLTNNGKCCKLVTYGCNTMSTKQISPWAENTRFGQDCLLEPLLIATIYTARGDVGVMGCRGHGRQDQSR
jgi:hypothetical protein